MSQLPDFETLLLAVFVNDGRTTTDYETGFKYAEEQQWLERGPITVLIRLTAAGFAAM